MLVRFDSSETGEILMFADAAKDLLQAIGKETTARGAFTQAEMAGALDVYAQAILLGFQGRYRMEASDDLRRVAEHALGKRNADPSRNAPWLPALEHPAGKRPKERTGRRLWWITIGLPLAALSIYALLAFLVDH